MFANEIRQNRNTIVKMRRTRSTVLALVTVCALTAVSVSTAGAADQSRSDLFERVQDRVLTYAYFTIVGCLLHSGNPKMLRSPSRPAPALSQPGHGPAPTTEETPALLLGRPSGGLWMQRGRLVSEDHCTPMAPRVCRKPGPQQVGVT